MPPAFKGGIIRRREAIPHAGSAFRTKSSYDGGRHRATTMSVLRTGICVLVAFAVLAHGAVEPWSEAVLEMGAAVLLLVWVGQAWTSKELKFVWNPLLWPLLGFWLVAAFQLLARCPAAAAAAVVNSVAPSDSVHRLLDLTCNLR